MQRVKQVQVLCPNFYIRVPVETKIFLIWFIFLAQNIVSNQNCKKSSRRDGDHWQTAHNVYHVFGTRLLQHNHFHFAAEQRCHRSSLGGFYECSAWHVSSVQVSSITFFWPQEASSIPLSVVAAPAANLARRPPLWWRLIIKTSGKQKKHWTPES